MHVWAIWPLEVAASLSTSCPLPEAGFAPRRVKRLLFHPRAAAPQGKQLHLQLSLAAPRRMSRRLEIRPEQLGGKTFTGYPIGDALSAAGNEMGLWGAREGLCASSGGAAAGGRARL